MDIDLHILASGSAGNAAVLCYNHSAILIDAGISQKRLFNALAAVNVSARDLDGVLVTHKHGDHYQCAQEVSHRLSIPVIGPFGMNWWHSGGMVRCGQFCVMAHEVPHDVQTLAFMISPYLSEGRWNPFLAWITDTGHVDNDLFAKLFGCKVLFVEANHDSDMLRACGYPEELKHRIAGPQGHLSNRAVADLIESLDPQVRLVIAGHVSSAANDPALAMCAMAGAAVKRQYPPQFTVVTQDDCPRSFSLGHL